MRALITGASSGIGRDMARELAKRNYELVLVARDEERLKELQKEFTIKTTIIPMDLSSEENCKKLYEQEKDIDILINNAGFGTFGSFDETDLDMELNLIKTNVTAVHILTKLYLKDMIKEDKGIILNVSSIAGFMPGPLMAAYYASKAYVLRLSEGIRAELKKKKSKVQISVLTPGPVNTNFNNVANVKFNLHSLSSPYVAKYTINKLFEGKFIITPGITIKLARFFTKIIPNSIIVKFVYYAQERKRGE